MPKIKKFQPGASPRLPPTPFGQGESSGLQQLGQTVAGAGQEVGKALEAGEQRRAKEEAGMNAARVSAGSGSFMVNATRLFEDDQTGYLRTQGAQALEGRDATLKELQALGQAEIDAVDDPKVKALVQQRIQKASLGFERRLFEHASQQGDVVADRSFVVDSQGWMDTALKATDPAVREEAIDQLGFIAMANMARKGGREEDIIKAGDLARGEAHRGIVVGLTEDDPAAALNYLLREDVQETLDQTFIDDQTVVARDNLVTAAGKRDSLDIAEGALDARGYIDENKALAAYDEYANGDPAIEYADGVDDHTAEATKTELDKLLKEGLKRKSKDLYNAFGRGGMAVTQAIDRGHRNPIAAVDPQDKQFLMNMGAEGVAFWNQLKRMAQVRQANRANKNAGGVGRMRFQTIMSPKAKQDLLDHLDQYRTGANLELPDGSVVFLQGLDLFNAKWGPVLNDADLERLGNLYVDRTSGEIRKDTSRSTVKAWETQARKHGRLAPRHQEDTEEQALLLESKRMEIEDDEAAIRQAEKREPNTKEKTDIINKHLIDATPLPEKDLFDKVFPQGFFGTLYETVPPFSGLARLAPLDDPEEATRGFDLIPDADVEQQRRALEEAGVKDPTDQQVLDAWLKDQGSGR